MFCHYYFSLDIFILKHDQSGGTLPQILSKEAMRNDGANQTYRKVKKKIGVCLLPIKSGPFDKTFLKSKRRNL